EEQVKLQTFPSTLEGKARDWFWGLPPKSITSWHGLQEAFLARYFPNSRISEVRKKIAASCQSQDEKWYQYWERYNKLCESCPYHGLTEGFLI
ncbi:hypothetical protein Q8G71_34440, partial [Klebsiella pneumoniae]